MYNNEGIDESAESTEIATECVDEIYTKCTICQCNRLAAYWDEELESYIHLCDEPAICIKCSSATEFFSEEIQSQISVQEKFSELVS